MAKAYYRGTHLVIDDEERTTVFKGFLIEELELFSDGGLRFVRRMSSTAWLAYLSHPLHMLPNRDTGACGFRCIDSLTECTEDEMNLYLLKEAL